MRWVVVIAILLIAIVSLHSIDGASAAAAANKKDVSDADKLKQRIAQEKRAAEREATRKAAEKAERRAKRKREREHKQREEEKRKKETEKEAKLDPAVRKKLKRAAARDRRKRIERRRLDRIKTRLDAARRRNAASARARAERRRSKRTQRAATAKKLDKWLADRRDSESISTKSKSLTKLRFIHRKLNATASAAANSKRATASAPDRIWSLNGPSEFKEYVFDNPRPYGLVIALTALGAAQKCEYCVAVHKLFEPLSQLLYADAESIIATHYNSSVNAKTVRFGTVGSGSGSGEDGSTAVGTTTKLPFPVFVAELDVEKGRDVFGWLGLRGAPSIFYAPPKLSGLMHGADLESWVKALGNANQFVLQQDTKLTDLLTWVNKVTSKSLEPPAKPLHKYWFTVAPAGVVVALIGFMYRVYIFKLSRVWQWLFTAGSFGLLAFCWGGGWYSILNDLSFSLKTSGGWSALLTWSGLRRFKIMDAIEKGGGGQSGAEGLLFGSSQIILAIGIIALTKRAKYRTSPLAAAPAAAEGKLKAEPAANGSADANGSGGSGAGSVEPAAAAESIGTQILLFPFRAVYYIAYFVISVLFGPLPLYPRSPPQSHKTHSAAAQPPAQLSSVVRTVRWALTFAVSIVTSPLVIGLLTAYGWVVLQRVYTVKNGSYNYGFLHKAPMA